MLKVIVVVKFEIVEFINLTQLWFLLNCLYLLA